MKSFFNSLSFFVHSRHFRGLLATILLPLLFGCQTDHEQSSTGTVSYQCKNDIEIQCTSTGCKSEAANFTPLSVSFDMTGALSVCAYTGCWEGRAKVMSDENFILLNAQNLKFSTSDETQNITLALDFSDNVAILKAGSFAQPLLCDIK